MTKVFLSALSLLLFVGMSAQVTKVNVQKDGEKWVLKRNGEPYFIKGAGGQTYLDKLVEIGGNSIRTWGTDNAQEVLDEAHAKGLTVMLGLWVQHERHGFDYDDPIAVRKQLEAFRKDVMKYKDHPALLLWGVGNEVDLQYSNTKVWNAVQDIAAMIHELDPNHPTTTVTAGLDSKEVELVLANCPDIDIYSVNTYGDIAKVPASIRKFGWNGPYMITEWGVNGHWECPKTEFGVPIEQTSHEKAMSFDERYSLIENDSLYCLGSYAFLWGAKQETTSTWYGLFTPDGDSGEAVDVIQRRWGSEPENRAPVLRTISLDGRSASESIYVISGDLIDVSIDVSDPDGDKLISRWSVVSESTDKKSGGDAEKAPPSIPGTVKSSRVSTAVIRAPKQEGPYRVFVFVKDGNGHAGTANIPFYCLPRPDNAEQARSIEFKQKELDLPERIR